MIIKNYELEGFIVFLSELKLESTASRMRTRLKNILLDKYKMLSEERAEIGRHYARKDEQGNVVMKALDGQEVFDIEDERSAGLALQELMVEEVIIDQTAGNSQMLLSVKESILNYSEKLSHEEADRWDRYCVIMEGVFEGIGD
jgi:hypothetical protein